MNWDVIKRKECGVKIRHKPLRTLVSTAVLGVLATGALHAGGFSLYTEGAGYTTGNFAAGVAAEAADASTGWYNPAGLVLIRDQQAVFAGVGVFPTAKLSGVSTYSTINPRPAPSFVYSEVFNNINGAEDAFVPSFHYALPLGENATFGLSVVSPFGLATDWGPDSPVRYQATFTELITTNISPEIGGRLTEHVALGAGLDLQYARVKYNRVLGAPNIFNALDLNPMSADSLTYNKGHSFGVGFHVGVLGMFNDNHTRLGVNYQSEMRHEFYGYSRLTGPLASPGNILVPFLFPAPGVFQSDDLFSNAIDLPDVVTISAYHDVNDKFALLGSLVYTAWSSYKTVQLTNVAAPRIATPPAPGAGGVSQVKAISISPQNYTDTLRVAIGANYHVNDKLMLRVGGGYDPTPTNDIDRDVRLPDTDRWALSAGAHYQATNNIGVDIGYTHLFTSSDPVINRTDAFTATTSYNVTATGTAGANLVGVQATWVIDKEPPAPTK
ncbi:TPA: outer membrane beta-barrel protein [Legionella pneumophila]|uniref:Long chain fatty acid transporter n=1 Tax=Legionella pneumophila subsp. pascullei TaxID=91890 RepID=A0AAX2IXT0_LEGPN|nr:long-chain fatty acid transporter [Legionella pneumophila subsp. pascullei]HAT6915485.1 outer membrane beta-barrel protein [Legionella pneumophila]SQG90666.1 long chain fatty acid transporter [Legionella pneumophila subsp. pascullei]VEH07211.1 long chain fatty acid transporter [Legionella pneumophila subsp. pascullei]HAT6919215.1 outer membrane beta-barrel protein [Legionella pneumophila]